METTNVTSQLAANPQENTPSKGKMKEADFAGILKSIGSTQGNPKDSSKEGTQAEGNMDLLAYLFTGAINTSLDKEPMQQNNDVELQNFFGTKTASIETILNPELVTVKIVAVDVEKEISGQTLKEIIKEVPGPIKNVERSEQEQLGKFTEANSLDKGLNKEKEAKIFSLEYREISYIQKTDDEKPVKMMIFSKSAEENLQETVKVVPNLAKSNISKNDEDPIFSIEKPEALFKAPGEAPTIKNSHDNVAKVQDAMIKLFETTTEGQTTKMRVTLHPESLGKVDIGLTMEGGKLTAKIQVENSQIKELFANKLGELNQSLARQGLVIEKIHVEVKTQSENLGMNMNQQGNFNQQGKRQWASRMNNIFKDEFSHIEEFKGLSFENGVSLLA